MVPHENKKTFLRQIEDNYCRNTSHRVNPFDFIDTSIGYVASDDYDT
jgi:hypothetical protein